jgi:hypothetical protein
MNGFCSRESFIAVLLFAAAFTIYAEEAPKYKVGIQRDGSVVLPDNQILTPAGKQVQFVNELTQATAATSKIEKAWQKASTKMFAVRPKEPDRQDENLLNRAIWYCAFNFSRPYPGDSKILLPQEVRSQFHRSE